MYDFNCFGKIGFFLVHSYGFIENVCLSCNYLCIYVYITGERALTFQFIMIYILFSGHFFVITKRCRTYIHITGIHIVYLHTFYVHNFDYFFILVCFNRKSDIVSLTAIGEEKTVFHLEHVDINNKFFFHFKFTLRTPFTFGSIFISGVCAFLMRSPSEYLLRNNNDDDDDEVDDGDGDDIINLIITFKI